jgi:hypothetical protein
MTAAGAEDVRHEWLHAIKTERDAVEVCESAELITVAEAKRVAHQLAHDRDWALRSSFEDLFLTPHHVQEV